MPPRNKKFPRPQIADEGTASGRRSSLQVNLSFVSSSSSDSGNETFARTPTENRDVSENETSRSDFGRRPLSVICEDAAISEINEMEQALDQSCQRLKAAILSKTQELFDHRAELSVKTANVLRPPRQVLKDISDDFDSASNNKKTELLRDSLMQKSAATRKHLGMRSFRSTSRSVSASSSVAGGNKSGGDDSARTKKKSDSSKVSLMQNSVSKKQLGMRSLRSASRTSSTASSIAEVNQKSILSGNNKSHKDDTSKLPKKSASSKISLLQNCAPIQHLEPRCLRSTSRSNSTASSITEGNRSFILTGSNKSQGSQKSSKVIDKVLTIRLTRIDDSLAGTCLNTSQCSTLPDEIGAPLTCSSFLSGRGNHGAPQRAEVDDRRNSEKSNTEKPPAGRAESSGDSLTPMEITAVQEAISSSNKNSRSLRLRECGTKRSRDSTNFRCREDVSMELTTVQNHIIPGDFSGSDGTARTSLNVNTSADDFSHPGEKRRCRLSLRISERKDDTRSDLDGQVSLRVNTSVGSRSSVTRETEDNDSKAEKSAINDTRKAAIDRNKSHVALRDNAALIAKLRDLSSRKSTEPANNSRVIRVDKSPGNNSRKNRVDEHPGNNSRKNRIDEHPGNKSRKNRVDEHSANNSRKNRDDEHSTNNSRENRDDEHPVNTTKTDFAQRYSREGPSFIEGTPFPPSRSMLWRTYVENAVRKRVAKKSPPAANPESDSDSSTSTVYLTPPNGTIVIADSPSRQTSYNIPNPQIIEDSSEEEQQQQPVKSASTKLNALKENEPPNTQRPGKKKLLSLHQDFQLVSLSPMSSVVLSPKKPTTWKPRRKFQKRKAVRAKAAKRIESSRAAKDDEACSLVSRIQTQKEKAKAKKPRKVMSKKIVVKKIAGRKILEQIEGMARAASTDCDSTAGGRSSMNEFRKKRGLPIDGRVLKPQRLVIVHTGFSKEDEDRIKSFVKDLGGAEINPHVTRRTTHVVSTGVRTINLLRGIIRGCWLVSLDWVADSAKQQKWINPEQYEMNHFSKAVQENRRDRQLFGKAYVPELFTTCGPIHVEKGSNPPPEILKELIKTAGGRIAEYYKDSKLCVGPQSLREIWILDSITTGELQPIADYERT